MATYNAITVGDAYDQYIESYTKGKKEVSGVWFWGFAILAVAIAAINAFMNAAYGYESGTGALQSLLIGAAFLLLDLALIALAYRYFPGWLTAIMAVVSLAGLIPLSMFAATSFMVGQQHTKDDIVVQSQQALVKGLQARVSATDPSVSPINYRDASRELSRETDKLNRIIKENGGYVSGSSAVYHYIAKTMDSSVEKVTLIVRATWSIVFVFVSVTLGGMLNLSYTVGTLTAYAKRMQERDVSDIRARRDYTVALSKAPALLRGGKERSGNAPGNAPGSAPGALRERLEAVADGVRQGRIHPSWRGIKGAGIGSDEATRMHRELVGRGVIRRKGRGYVVA